MDLESYIKILSKYPRDKVLPVGFANPHSWRGSYYELCFSPVDNVSIGDMIDAAESCVGKVFDGWKGGEYKMQLDSEVNFESSEGVCSYGKFMGSMFIDLLVQQSK